MMRKIMVAGVVLAALTGCESGTYQRLDLTIPDAVSDGFSAEAPGVVVTDLTGPALPILALCGQSEDELVQLYIDGGFGCLADGQKGTEVSVTAWVQPHPQAWTAEEICASERTDDRGTLKLPSLQATSSTATPASDTGGAAVPTMPDEEGGLAPAADGTWAQGFDVAKWRRDGSPCGGNLRAEIEMLNTR